MCMTLEEYLREVAEETAKMSYPGHFSPPLCKNAKKGPKETVQRYFTGRVFIRELTQLWRNRRQIPTRVAFNEWHNKRVQELGRCLRRCSHMRDGYNARAAARKLIDVFMHQLMKYQRFRRLYRFLYLPLDRQVCRALRRKRREDEDYGALNTDEVKELLDGNRNPYNFEHADYLRIQEALLHVVRALQRDPRLAYRASITSRVDLNALLW
jgi:hypothetical protein